MTPDLLILRPEPGASETAARAAALGLSCVQTPIFTIEPLPWSAPGPEAFEAVLLTSANAARHAGPALKSLAHLPCYAVGDATAAAAAEFGFAAVVSGSSDGRAVIATMRKQGIGHAFHPCGRDRMPLNYGPIAVEERAVYAAEAVEALPELARRALAAGATALLHSPRAARLFARLVDAAGLARGTISLAAISEAASTATGEGWKSKSAAPRPRDDALLELAAKLCQNGGAGTKLGG